jgi:hypothetical protein
MFLYEKKESAVNVYSLEAKKDALKEYRKQILVKEKLNELFWLLEIDSKNILDRFIREDEIDIGFLRENDNNSSWWSNFQPQDSKNATLTKTKEILYQGIVNKYINGELADKDITIAFIPDGGVDCYLGSYMQIDNPITIDSTESKKYYRLENIMKLPTELLVLHLLETGKFDAILRYGFDFNKQISLFEIDKVDSIDYEEINKMINFGLLNNARKIENTINVTEKILKKFNKIII